MIRQISFVYSSLISLQGKYVHPVYRFLYLAGKKNFKIKLLLPVSVQTYLACCMFEKQLSRLIELCYCATNIHADSDTVFS